MRKYDIQIGDRYGVINGDQRLVFIKTGRGGTIYGHQNKYLKLATELSARTGYSVVVSANPLDSACELPKEIGEITAVTGEPDAILFVGVSNGALIGAQQGWTVEKIRAMLLINGPLMINWLKTKKGLEKFQGDKVELIYGSRDPSFPYVGLLDRVDSRVCSYKVMEGIDHNFLGEEDAFGHIIAQFVKESELSYNNLEGSIVMGKDYFLHRISHEWEVSYPLLDAGYLSIGWSYY